MSETTKKLIESQTEAVKALTDAVKATVPGVEGARAKPRVEKSREHEETESQGRSIACFLYANVHHDMCCYFFLINEGSPKYQLPRRPFVPLACGKCD